MQAGVGLLDTDMMPIFHNHCLRYRHNFALFYQLLDSNLFTQRIIFILREASSETYGPQVYFPSYKFHIYYFAIFYFPIYIPKPPPKNIFCLVLFIYLYHISLLQVSVKGFTTPLSHWVQVVWLFVHVLVICVLSPTGLIPWFSNWGKYLSLLCCITLSSSRENQRKLKK